MANYFSSINRHFARLRCVEETVNSILEKRPVPESLCYIPSFEFFEVSASNLDIPKSIAFTEFYEEYHDEPRQLKFYDGDNLFLCSRRCDRDSLPEWMKKHFETPESKQRWKDATFLEIIGVWHKNSPIPEFFEKPLYHLWSSSPNSRPSSAMDNESSTGRGMVRLRSGTLVRGNQLGEAGGCKYVFDRWEEVVELTYGVTVAKDELLKFVTPCDRERVSKMCQPPSTDWDHRQDEALVQFLVETGQAADDKGGRASDVRSHVDKIVVSSSIEHKDDAVNALTDDNPNSYWESDGSHPHYIRLHMKKNTIIEKIYITVEVSDDSYIPQKISVLASDRKAIPASDMKVLNEIDDLEVSYSGDVCIYESLDEPTKSYSLVEIQILECKDEGIDTRIRGLKIKTKHEDEPFSNLDVHIDENRLRECPILFYSAVDLQTMKRRALVLKRTAILLDSVMQSLVPDSPLLGAEKEDGELDNFDEMDAPAPFLDLLEKCRFLFPLLHKRQLIFERFLKDTESKKLDACPKLYINRQLARENRTDPESTVFHQVYEGLKSAVGKDEIVLDYRWSLKHEQWWECKFLGEGVIDQGGGFRDSLCDIGEELCFPDADSQIPLPYFVRAPNQHEDEHNRDTFVVNPGCGDFDGFEWIGKLLGACLRTKEHLILPLTKFTWKRIVGQPVSWIEDFVTVDKSLVRQVEKIQHMQTKEEFDQFFGIREDENGSTPVMTAILCNGDSIELVPGGSNVSVSFENRLDYVRLLKEFRLKEGVDQIKAIRRGLMQVVPESALRLITWFEMEGRVSGNPEVSLDALKKSARYEELEGTEKRVQYLWDALATFTNEERSKFLRFVTGRRRLPTPLYICTNKGDTLIPTDADRNILPESSTCSNTLFLPDYPSAQTCEEKLRYAIHNCLAIDNDMSPWEE